jgi:hypothetical protein
MRITFIFLLYLSVASICNSTTKFELKDISRDTIIHLTSESGTPSSIVFKVKGFASDTFMLQEFLKIPGGVVDSSFTLDCYTKDYYLSYKALKAKKGNLVIEYVIP